MLSLRSSLLSPSRHRLRIHLCINSNRMALKRLRSFSSSSDSSSGGTGDSPSRPLQTNLTTSTPAAASSSQQSTESPSSRSQIVMPRQKLIKSDLTSHWEYLQSQRLDPISIQSSRETDDAEFESGIVTRDITEGILNLPSMFDPRIHLPNAPLGWKGFEEATPLSNELVSYIAVRAKPMTVADFMRQALTHGAYGYYTNPTHTPVNDDDDFNDDFDLDESKLPHDVDVDTANPDSSPSNYIIGKKGDFVTAPEVSQVFGECLAIWFITQHDVLGSPNEIQIVEVGPGKGTLIQDVVRSLCTSFHEKMGSAISKIHLVEASQAMREAQRQKLEALKLPHAEIRFASDAETTTTTTDESGSPSSAAGSLSREHDGKQVITVHWYSTFTDFVSSTADNQIPTYVICQEFVDALPVHVFEKTVDGWRERVVDVAVAADEQEEKALIKKDSVPKEKQEKKTRLRIVLSPNVSPACKTLLNVNPETGQMEGDESPIGQVCEVCPEGILLVQDIAKLLQSNGGGALVVDYGQEGSTDSLRGFSRHQQVNFLSRPGRIDITADVDFSALRHAVNHLVVDDQDKKSIFAFGPITQGRFLTSMGIVERSRHQTRNNRLASSKEEEIAQLEAKLRQLKETEEQEKALVTAASTLAPVNAPNRLDEPLVEMLSESWREADPVENGSGGGFLPTLVGVVLAIVVLAFFSQEPVGQEDFSKYASVKTTTEVDLGDLNADRIKAIQGL
ncbi:protein arginine methyltransferase [Fragilaria crotonensis]|nr:protein arginine methyltransferase [Fragilaria crotonensis]